MEEARAELLRVRLPGRPSSVPEVRRLVRTSMSATAWTGDVGILELLVSELVTNAIVHAGTAVDVVVSVLGDTVEVEVSDGSSLLPRSRHYAATAGTGRGLLPLEALSDCWGVRPGATGKTAWFRLSAAAHEAHPSESPDEATSAPVPVEDVLVVELVNVPLRLHALWQEQAQALLRDYLLATLDRDPDPERRVLSHAACSSAVALLAEHIPEPDHTEGDGSDVDGSSADYSELPDEQWQPRVAVPVPQHAVQHFEALDEAMERALGLAGTGQLLAPVSDPAVRSLRRWLCRQVADQAAGRRPTPWLRSPRAYRAGPGDAASG